MSILSWIRPESFYTPVKANLLEPGHFCWIITPHVEEVPQILAVERSSPEEHEHVQFSLRQANQANDFISVQRVLPVKYLNLRSNEELLCQRAKRRRGIVLGSNMEIDAEMLKLLKQKGKAHLQAPHTFVVPCYSTQQGQYGTGFPPEMTQRAECLIYRQYFYCPENFQIHREMREAVARFDRIQVVVGKNPYAIRGLGVALSEEAFSIFRSMFLYSVSGEEDEDLAILRDLLRQSYVESATPKPNPPSNPKRA